MAALTTEQRQQLSAEWLRLNDETIGVVKSDVLATFAALDQFFEDNKAAVNNAIPAGPRAVLSTRQKAWILAKVIELRFKVNA